MSFFQGNYLRVLTPQTIDGINLAYDANQRPIFKETHLPLTARKHLERKNEKLPAQLKKKIEVVDVESYSAQEEVKQEPVTEKPTKNKPGPKKTVTPKTDSNDTQSNTGL
jgi:hypothetical protein